jgi:hypothetical protein
MFWDEIEKISFCLPAAIEPKMVEEACLLHSLTKKMIREEPSFLFWRKQTD